MTAPSDASVTTPQPQESWLRGLLGLAVLVLLLGGAYLWASTQVYTPAAQVKQHLQALSAGQLERALELAPQHTATAAGNIIGDATVAAAPNRYQDPQITAVAISGDTAKVTATVQHQGQTKTLEYEVVRDKQPVAGIFDNWIIPRFEYPVVEFVAPASASLFEVNGQQIDLAASGNLPSDINEEATVRFVVAPGDYTFKPLARTEFVTVSGQQSFSFDGAGMVLDAAASEPFAVAVTEAGQGEIHRLANAQIDACIAQPLSVPEGCAFEAWTYVAYTDGKWTLQSYPELVIDTQRTTFGGGGDSGQGQAGSAIFDFKYTDGNPGSREVKVYGDGYYTILPDHTLQIAFNRS